MVESIPVTVAAGFAIYLSLIDIREMRIPNRPLAIASLMTAISMIATSVYKGDFRQFFIALLGALISILLFFLIHLVRPKGLGMGDVKFAGLIGGTLAWISFPEGLMGLGWAFIFSSAFSLLVFVVRRQISRVIPFAPFMLAGLLFISLTNQS